MREICVRTKDRRLKRALELLLPEDYQLTETEENALLVADADTSDIENADLVISYESVRTDALYLKRPFSAAAFRALLSSLESRTHERLTSTEEKLFTLLRNANGAPVPRETLIKSIWGSHGTDGLLNLYIHYLREKLEKDGKRRIFASRGKGYFYKC